ncbi:hypothetical protein ACJX0J_036728, partial [Zea mays]
MCSENIKRDKDIEEHRNTNFNIVQNLTLNICVWKIGIHTMFYIHQYANIIKHTGAINIGSFQNYSQNNGDGIIHIFRIV